MEYNQTETNDILEQPNHQLPSMLNVLTILTFIGCGIAYLGSFWNFYSLSKGYQDQIDKINEQKDKMGDSGFGAKMMDSSLDVIQRSYEHRYTILAVTLVFTTLCLVGALQMRKLKKSGFTLYVIGELTPLIVSLILIGTSFAALMSIGFGGLIGVVFVILYATQRKYLVRD